MLGLVIAGMLSSCAHQPFDGHLSLVGTYQGAWPAAWTEAPAPSPDAVLQLFPEGFWVSFVVPDSPKLRWWGNGLWSTTATGAELRFLGPPRQVDAVWTGGHTYLVYVPLAEWCLQGSPEGRSEGAFVKSAIMRPAGARRIEEACG